MVQAAIPGPLDAEILFQGSPSRGNPVERTTSSFHQVRSDTVHGVALRMSLGAFRFFP
ncbi:hypothetical protein ASZ90_015972 [hydrocarbon metagenome]|uniref:Uncharacterized protein n=1 Tax=hydrocarbon metagenome TaxID=938273 RepID=A0A0W8F0F3_9ZZZZ